MCHFANATELDRIKSKGPILLDLIRSNSVRFSHGLITYRSRLGLKDLNHVDGEPSTNDALMMAMFTTR